MPILDASTEQVRQAYTVDQLTEQARQMRAWNLLCLHAAGSGHSGGTLSVMDIAAALYLHEVRHDPRQPDWLDRDRVVWSVGHKAPALYVALAWAGYFDKHDCLRLRKFEGGFEGHPNRFDTPGVEASTGSLGQGLSIAVGMALRARLDGAGHRVLCIMGDGEQQEGQIWESVMAASHHGLGNLVGIVDVNELQIDGPVREVMNVFPLDRKYEAFGWRVLECDGHDLQQLVDTLAAARAPSDRPTVILAHTVKGKGVSFMEGVAGWHGRPPDRSQLEQALVELNCPLDIDALLAGPQAHQQQVTARLTEQLPAYPREYRWNAAADMRVDMEPTRIGFGKALRDRGDDARLVCLGADISDSIGISLFYKDHPERRSRWLSMGIAEQSGTCVAAGLAREGKIPVFGTYGVFAAGRALDQLRTTVCYNRLNVKIAGAHGGVSVGPDGATHQALEEFYQVLGLPHMNVVAGVDAVEMQRLTETCLFEVDGPCYLRFAREATPIVTTATTPLAFGLANVIRYRGRQARFVDAFETVLARDYRSEGEDLAIISNGPELAEAMRAAWLLKECHSLETRVVNLHTLKPMDAEAGVRAARECHVVVTAEEHQVGGLGNPVAAAILEAGLAKDVAFTRIGVPDQFGASGGPWELLDAFGLSAEHLAKRCAEKASRHRGTKASRP